MNTDPGKQRAQGFIIIGLTTFAYLIYSVVMRQQAFATFHYVIGAVGLITLGLGVFLMARNQDR